MLGPRTSAGRGTSSCGAGVTTFRSTTAGPPPRFASVIVGRCAGGGAFRGRFLRILLFILCQRRRFERHGSFLAARTRLDLRFGRIDCWRGLHGRPAAAESAFREPFAHGLGQPQRNRAHVIGRGISQTLVSKLGENRLALDAQFLGQRVDSNAFFLSQNKLPFQIFETRKSTPVHCRPDGSFDDVAGGSTRPSASAAASVSSSKSFRSSSAGPAAGSASPCTACSSGSNSDSLATASPLCVVISGASPSTA